MKVDTFSKETQAHFEGSPLWKPWMTRYRLRQAIDLEDVKEFLEQHESSKIISWDVETDSLDPHHERVCGHCLAFNSKE